MGRPFVLAMGLAALSGCAVPPASDTLDAAGAPSWPRVAPSAELPRDRPLRVGFLVVDGVYNTELTAPYDVFQHTVFHAEPGMEVFTVSPDGGTVTTFEGLVLDSHYGFAT